MRFSKGIAVVTAVLAAVAVFSGAASACVGARPLAMGGAFIGLADDVNSTYWNPAGLVQMKQASGTWMHTSSNRDEINYQDYMAFAVPYSEKLAFGGSWINFNWLDEQDWYWVSLAYKLNPTMSVGLNVRTIDDAVSAIETDTAIDLAFYQKLTDQMTWGVLIQDANEPDVTIDMGEGSTGPMGIRAVLPGDFNGTFWGRNIRPGIAFRPDAQSIVTADIYDLLDDVNSRSLRIGYEKIVKNGLALRAGYYGLGTSDAGALTFGIGKTNFGGESFNNMSLDAAVMIGDIDTVLISTSLKF